MSGYLVVYDAATSSAAPRSTALLAGALALAAALRAAWRASRGQAPMDPLAGFLVFGALLFGAVAGAFAWERRWLRDVARLQVAEGAIAGLWHDRTVRGGRTVARWEGFRVGGVPFVYDVSTEDNYFRNHPSQGGPLGEGARVRLHYVVRGEGDDVRRHIVRVERAAD